MNKDKVKQENLFQCETKATKFCGFIISTQKFILPVHNS